VRPVTRTAVPNQTAKPHANVEYVRQSRIDSTPPPSLRKHSTSRGHALNKQSASSSASSVSRFEARRQRRSFVALVLGFTLIKSVHTALSESSRDFRSAHALSRFTRHSVPRRQAETPLIVLCRFRDRLCHAPASPSRRISKQSHKRERSCRTRPSPLMHLFAHKPL
jgi:hypothetical protein